MSISNNLKSKSSHFLYKGAMMVHFVVFFILVAFNYEIKSSVYGHVYTDSRILITSNETIPFTKNNLLRNIEHDIDFHKDRVVITKAGCYFIKFFVSMTNVSRIALCLNDEIIDSGMFSSRDVVSGHVVLSLTKDDVLYLKNIGKSFYLFGPYDDCVTASLILFKC